MADTGGRRRARGPRAATPWEWVLGGAGALLTLGTIGYLGWEGIAQPRNAVPQISVGVDSIVRQPDGWLVRIEARNSGMATAAGVRIVGELRADTGAIETSEVTLDYVPEASSQEAGLMFTQDPAAYRLELRASGYERP